MVPPYMTRVRWYQSQDTARGASCRAYSDFFSFLCTGVWVCAGALPAWICVTTTTIRV